MPLNTLLVLAAFAFLLGVLLLQGLRHRNPAGSLIGYPPIERLYFYSAKGAFLITWILFALKAVLPGLGYVFIPPFLMWAATGLLWTGVLIMSLAILNIGHSLAIGLPRYETRLKTSGLYRFSRNPIYLGAYLISIASCLYFPDLINVAFTLYSLFIHHTIIRSEERFLRDRFGKEWEDYAARVRRYI